MSAVRRTVRPGDAGIITNNSETAIKIWTGEPPRFDRLLRPGQSDLIPNPSDADLIVQYEHNDDISFDRVDLD
jgi:hypothetical protein